MGNFRANNQKQNKTSQKWLQSLSFDDGLDLGLGSVQVLHEHDEERDDDGEHDQGG